MRRMLWTLVISCLAFPGLAGDVDVPTVHDGDLEVVLFAREPMIVTPIGAAVDEQGRLFVVESHTHLPDADYAGPKSDRIKVLLDSNRDGRADESLVFADGFEDAMNLAFSLQGQLYLCHRAGVTRFIDADSNGVSDSHEQVLRLETGTDYSHSGLLGIAFGGDGWMYVSRGNVGGHPYRLIAADGSTLSNYGDGGNVVRLRPDGSRLEEVATGFWNPFAMTFDRHGRLLLVDNDPDSRGPNRLVHIIPGGDYGFRTLYGQSGLHPFCAWNGELPGTLPMVSATGEAPSGILDAAQAALPHTDHESVLVTSWLEATIERISLRPSGTSIKGDREPWMTGGPDFRPVGIAAAPDGAIFVTDWVKKDYPNHGQGRIWRITTQPGVPVRAPSRHEELAAADNQEVRLREIQKMTSPADFGGLIELLKSEDPFVRTSAIGSLSRPQFRSQVRSSLQHENLYVRAGALMALRRAGEKQTDGEVRQLLKDDSVLVRKAALMAASEARRRPLKDNLESAIRTIPVTAELLDFYLAAQQSFSEDIWQQASQKTPGFAIRRTLDETLVDHILFDATMPPELTAVALRFARNVDRESLRSRIEQLLKTGDSIVQREAVRTLAMGSSRPVNEVLLNIALDSTQPPELRADAVQGLSGKVDEDPTVLLPLLEDRDAAVRIQTVRTLRPLASHSKIRDGLQRALQATSSSHRDAEFREQLEFALSPPSAENSPPHRPGNEEEWWPRVATGGSPESGRRVFFDSTLNCAGCHRMHGRGSGIGPDLSVIGRTLDRGRLFRAILVPSAEIAPEFQVHTLVTADGRTISGIQFHFRDGGDSASIIPSDGTEIRFRLTDLESYQASSKSLMPDGLQAQMTVADLSHLLAFLETCDYSQVSAIPFP